MSETFDFVAIGDVVTDAFIRIEQASVYFDEKDHEEKLAFTNGAKIPYEFVKVIPAVGNSANAAVSAVRLGLKTAFVTDLGDDEHGKEIFETLKNQGVDIDFAHVHPGKLSNYHYVLWYKAERTILIKHEDYDRTFPNVGSPKWIYMSSLGDNTLPYHQGIMEYLKTNPEVKLAFQPGTFQIKMGTEALKEIYTHTEVFFCNKEEAQIILKIPEAPCPDLARKMSELGPKISVITDGPKGAYAYDSKTDEMWFMPPYPDPAPPYDRTGAGDAFSSTFAACLALGKTVEEAFKWAPINSMSVVQKIGAQEGLLHPNEIEEWLAKAPENYKPTRV
jgi:ribokinase